MPAENLTRDEARERARLLTVDSYDVQLDLSLVIDEPTIFRSSSTIRFGCTEPGAQTHLDITADRIVAATLNDEPIDIEAAFNGHRLELPPLAADNVLQVVANCVYSRTGEGLHRFVDPVDKEVYLYSQFETFDAHRMFACFDQPDLKATFAFTVDAPQAWRVISNMPGSQDGERRVFERTPRQSTYITAIVAGNYVGADDSTTASRSASTAASRSSSTSTPTRSSTVTKQGFDAFHDLFDFRYPWPKYDQVFVPEFNMGAMENAGCVTFTEDYVFRSRTTDSPTSGARSPCCTRWRTCGSATWSPCAGGTTCGSTSRSRSASPRKSPLTPPAGPTPGRRSARSRRPGPTGRTSCRPRTRSPRTSSTSRR